MESTKFFKNDSSEVLVLPPNILEELGINLGNIQSYTNEGETKPGVEAHVDETNTLNMDRPNVLSDSHNKVCDKESSILETANLMKASVFLSPTFTNLKSNNVINDLQHKIIETVSVESNNNKEINNTKSIEIIDKPISFFENKDSDPQAVKNNNSKAFPDMLPKLNNKVYITSEEIIGSEKLKELVTSEVLDDCNLMPVPINIIMTKSTATLNKKVSDKLFKKNNQKECNDDNNENSLNILPSNGFTTEVNENSDLNLQNQPHDEILFRNIKDDNFSKILKEVNIENERDEELSINDNFVDKIILEKEIHSTTDGMVWNSDKNFSNELNENASDFVKRDYNNSVNYEDLNYMNSIKEDINDKKVNKGNNNTDIDSKCNYPAADSENTVNIVPKKDLDHEEVNSITQSVDVTQVKDSLFDNTNLDSVQKVVMKSDLSQIENREICNNSKIINVNKNKVKSKLCIQGVEKPGGECESDHKGIYVKDLKTYSRNKRTKFSKTVLFEKQDCLMSNLDIDVDIDCNINNTYIIEEMKPQKFCICKDFGYFSYYDKDIDYQHIHYWEQKGAECSLEMLLSIYDEKKVIEINEAETDNNEINIAVESENESNFNVSNICWMNLNTIFTNTKDKIESSEEINQQANILQTFDSIDTSQSNNTELIYTKSKETQVKNVELENVSQNHSKHINLDKSKKRNRKRKIAEDDLAEINASQNFSTTSKSDDVNVSKISNEKDTAENVPSTETSLRKAPIRKEMSKPDNNKYESANQPVDTGDILLNVTRINKLENDRDREINRNKNDTIINKHSSKTDKKITKKRKMSILLSEGSPEETNKKKKKEIRIKCGVCKTSVESSSWDHHVTNDHCFIAWQDGQQFDFNNEDLFIKLKQYLNDNGKLICMICDKTIKRVKKFLSHVEECITNRNPFTKKDDSIKAVAADKSESTRLQSKPVTCGVCKTEVKSMWMEHMVKEHNYLAWKEGETPLDFGDDKAVHEHLHSLIADIGKLECNSCGMSFKYANIFLKHIKKCAKTNEQMDTSALVEVIMSIKCGVCQNEVSSNEWLNHISKEHKYLAWKEGEPELDVADSHTVYQHLYNLSKQLGGLQCLQCGCIRKYVNAFLKHVESCDGDTNPNCTMDSTMNESSASIDKTLNIDTANDNLDDIAKCGVCQKEVDQNDWEFHIKKYHSYKAWKDGQTPLNLDDEEEVYNHLYAMSKKYNGLTCNGCGMTRKYVKVFLDHIESCNTQMPDIKEAILQEESYKCGVCGENVQARDWKSHAMSKHYNVAWPEGQTAIDSKNPTAVEKCLKEYKQVYSKFVCAVCGLTRASAIGFYAHVIQCGRREEEIDPHRDVCKICNNKYLVIYKNQHMSMHRDQEYTKQRKLNLELEKEEKKKQIVIKTEISDRRVAAERALNVIERYKKYKHNCTTCDFGADSEEDVKNHACKKANYNLSNSEESIGTSSEPDSDETDINSNLSNEEQEEIQKTLPSKRKKHPDLNPAAAFLPFTVHNPKAYLNESADDFCKNHLTSNVLYPQWRTCKFEAVPDEQLPNYLPTVEESCKVILHKGDWITLKKLEGRNDRKWGEDSTRHGVVSTSDINHLIKNKLDVNPGSASSETAFIDLISKEASAAFAGGCVRCVSWAPPRCDRPPLALCGPPAAHCGPPAAHCGPPAAHCGPPAAHYLSAAAHARSDAPRLRARELHAHPHMLQLWDYGDLQGSPKFALGIALDFGTVWAKDWCPSGTRDVLSDPDTKSFTRLGLLAVACSNGSAYILSVPYPSTITEGEKKVYKLTPVAELRLTRGNRQRFQATAINWPSQKGHSTIIVGYSDGTTALYNLDCDSPILTDTEDGMKIYYPFQDERTHNSCVTALSSSVGAAGSSSSTGGARAALRGAGRGAPRTRCAVTGTGACFTPHWPDLLLAGNDAIVYQAPNVVSWCGGGRRLGSQQAACGCARCGLVAVAAPPALRLVTAHPAHTHLHKTTVALLQMKPLVNKKTKQKNDDLGTRLEPSTYGDAIKKYGVELKIVEKFNKSYLQQSNKPRDHYPERFPLSDVSSMAFNLSPKEHKKLAVAIHAGLIFVITV